MHRVRQEIGLVTLLPTLLLGGVCSGPASAQEQEAPSTVRVTLADGYPPGTVIGIVYDSGTGRGLEAVQVHVEGTGVGALTDSLGRFTLHGVPPGTVSLAFVLIGYTSIRQEVILDEERALALAAAMEESQVDLCGLIVCGGPFGCYSFEVIVRDMETGIAPEVEVNLRIRGREISDSMSLRAAPDQDFVHLGVGNDMVYAGPGWDPGPYDIELTAPGYAPWRQSGIDRGRCGRFSANPHPVWLVPGPQRRASRR